MATGGQRPSARNVRAWFDREYVVALVRCGGIGSRKSIPNLHGRSPRLTSKRRLASHSTSDIQNLCSSCQRAREPRSASRKRRIVSSTLLDGSNLAHSKPSLSVVDANVFTPLPSLIALDHWRRDGPAARRQISGFCLAAGPAGPGVPPCSRLQPYAEACSQR